MITYKEDTGDGKLKSMRGPESNTIGNRYTKVVDDFLNNTMKKISDISRMKLRNEDMKEQRSPKQLKEGRRRIKKPTLATLDREEISRMS